MYVEEPPTTKVHNKKSAEKQLGELNDEFNKFHEKNEKSSCLHNISSKGNQGELGGKVNMNGYKKGVGQKTEPGKVEGSEGEC